jgi:hypothetical protein
LNLLISESHRTHDLESKVSASIKSNATPSRKAIAPQGAVTEWGCEDEGDLDDLVDGSHIMGRHRKERSKLSYDGEI